jgi:hypothetical protein
LSADQKTKCHGKDLVDQIAAEHGAFFIHGGKLRLYVAYVRE